MKETIKVLVCDVCGEKLEYKEQTYIGGHPTNGWFRVTKISAGTDLYSLQENSAWDVCSLRCLKNLDPEKGNN